MKVKIGAVLRECISVGVSLAAYRLREREITLDDRAIDLIMREVWEAVETHFEFDDWD